MSQPEDNILKAGLGKMGMESVKDLINVKKICQKKAVMEGRISASV